MKHTTPFALIVNNIKDLDTWYVDIANSDPILALMINNMGTHPNIDYYNTTSSSQLLKDECLEGEEVFASDCIEEWNSFEPNQKLIAYCIACGVMKTQEAIGCWQSVINTDMESTFTFMPRKSLQEYLGLNDNQMIGVHHNTLVKWAIEKEKKEEY